MNTIDNHNCTGLCVERFCSNQEAYFEIIEMNSLEIFIALCERHMEKWMEVKEK